MAELVTITIDDVEYQVPKGMLLTDAAKLYFGIDIPVFCSHPKLDPIGACRMCLVEQDVRGRWVIATACTTRVTEGMKFRYASPAAEQAREDTLEFLLINHPLDCPICDKGGECPLQDQTLKHGPGRSHFQEIKTHKEKRYPVSDLILLDQERCVICWRCIRYLEEWEDKPQLGLFHRGGETVIDFFPGQPVDAKTSGNIIDLCPVGALTNRISRFRYRPWELKRTNSICTHCSQGCNVRLDARIHQLRRIVARENMAVNDEWICDKGRFVHGFVDHPERLASPLVRDGEHGGLREATWEEALTIVVERLSEIVDHHGPSAVGAIGSAKLSNEAAYLLQKFMRVLVGSNNVDHKGGADVLADPRGLSHIRDVERADLIVFAGVDPAEEQPVMDTFIRRAVQRRGARLLILHPREIEDTRYPGTYVAYRPGQEVTLLEDLGRILLREKRVKDRVAKMPGYAEWSEWIGAGLKNVSSSPKSSSLPSQVAQRLDVAAALLANAERPLILYGPAMVSGRNAEANRTALLNLALLAGCLERTYYLAPEANSVGVRDMGLLPNHFPGHVAISNGAARDRLQRLWGGRVPVDAGLTCNDMLQSASSGRLKGLYLVASDPASEGPAGRAAVEKAAFVVVQDLFLTETAKLADVVLPAVSWAETDGTFTNLERRVQRAPQALRHPHSQAQPDWSILAHLAQRWPSMGVGAASLLPSDRKGKKSKARQASPATKPWTYTGAQAVLEEIGRAVAFYEGMAWAALGDEGKQWPAESVPGWPRRFVMPSIAPASAASALAGRDATGRPGSFPYVLVTGRVLFDNGTLVRTTEGLDDVIVPGAAGINPDDAEREKLQAGEVVTLISTSGSLTLPVRVDESVQPGTIWIPYSLPGASVETLLDLASDGVGTAVRFAVRTSPPGGKLPAQSAAAQSAADRGTNT